MLEVLRILHFRVVKELSRREVVETHAADKLVDHVCKGKVVVHWFAKTPRVREYHYWRVISVLACLLDENVARLNVSVKNRVHKALLEVEEI